MLDMVDYGITEDALIDNNIYKHILCFDLTPITLLKPSRYNNGVLLDYIGLEKYLRGDTELVNTLDKEFMIDMVDRCLNIDKYNHLWLFNTDAIYNTSVIMAEKYSTVCIGCNVDNMDLNIVNEYNKLFYTYLHKVTNNHLSPYNNVELNTQVELLHGKFTIRDIVFNFTYGKSSGYLVVTSFYRCTSIK